MRAADKVTLILDSLFFDFADISGNGFVGVFARFVFFPAAGLLVFFLVQPANNSFFRNV